MKRIYLVIALFLAALFGSAQTTIDRALQEEMNRRNEEEKIEIIVLMKAQYDRSQLNRRAEFCSTRAERCDFVVSELKAFAEASQYDLKRSLNEMERSNLISTPQTLWSANALYFYATKSVILGLAQRNDIGMSLGMAGAEITDKVVLRRTCESILGAGIVALVCAGNEGLSMLMMMYPIPNNVRVPANCPPPYLDPDQMENPGTLSCVMAVGAVNYNDEAADFSSQGPVTWQDTEFGDYAYNPGIGLIRPDVCAPGVNIKSLDYLTTVGYSELSGTSQATPCVAGIVALMLQKNPELTPAQICQILEETSVKLTPNKSNITGVGRVDALAAVNAVPTWDGVSENTPNVNMFPNPTRDNVTVQCEGMRRIEVYALDGRLVKSLSVHSSECLIEGLECGVYFVRIGTGKENIVRKMVIM